MSLSDKINYGLQINHSNGERITYREDFLNISVDDVRDAVKELNNLLESHFQNLIGEQWEEDEYNEWMDGWEDAHKCWKGKLKDVFGDKLT